MSSLSWECISGSFDAECREVSLFVFKIIYSAIEVAQTVIYSSLKFHCFALIYFIFQGKMKLIIKNTFVVHCNREESLSTQPKKANHIAFTYHNDRGK